MLLHEDPLAQYLNEGGKVGFRLINPEPEPEPETEPEPVDDSESGVLPPEDDTVVDIPEIPEWLQEVLDQMDIGTVIGNINGNYSGEVSDNNQPPPVNDGSPQTNDPNGGVPNISRQPPIVADTSVLYNPDDIYLGGRVPNINFGNNYTR